MQKKQIRLDFSSHKSREKAYCLVTLHPKIKISDNKMPDTFIKVPEPTLGRLPWYLSYAKIAKQNGEVTLSSTQIANQIGVDASQVAKDFSYAQVPGKTRVGYNVDELIATLEEFLGFSHVHKAFLFGAGSLGGSLLHDNGLLQYGLDIVAAFDIKYELIGTHINHIPIQHTSKFAEIQRESPATVGVLTVPAWQAQSVADLMVAGGIKAIWNFTPYRITVPQEIVLQNTSIYTHLAVIYNRLSEKKENNKR